VPLTT